MEVARMASKGQVTIPLAIRRKLGLKDGDKVAFLQDGNNVVMKNASLDALHEVPAAFTGVPEEQMRDEEDLVHAAENARREKKPYGSFVNADLMTDEEMTASLMTGIREAKGGYGKSIADMDRDFRQRLGI